MRGRPNLDDGGSRCGRRVVGVGRRKLNIRLSFPSFGNIYKGFRVTKENRAPWENIRFAWLK